MSDDGYQVVDLFCGGGGFSLGFEHPERLNGLGNLDYQDIAHDGKQFEVIYSLDNYEAAASTIEKNFDSEVECRDISEVNDFSRWGGADVVIGGPPCQGFTQLNSKKTEDLDDERNELWREYFRAVEAIDPDVFVIENVPRFLDSGTGEEMIEYARNAGFNVVVDILNSADYGVPQKRKRAFVIGSQIGTPFLPAPTVEPEKTVRDAIGDLPIQPTNENLHNSRNFGKLTKDRMKHVPRGGNREDIPRYLLPNCWKDYEGGGTDLFGRLRWDEPAVTIRTSFHKPMKGRHLHPEGGLTRAITLREGARLQTFPDDYEFGSNYQVHIARLIGNAVPPKLAYHIAAAVKAHFGGLEGVKKSGTEKEFETYPEAHRQPLPMARM